MGLAQLGHAVRAEQRLQAAEQQSTPTVNQVCGNTWDIIADYGITDLARWRNASAAGLVETVKGMYSDAYLEVLGTESNLRQLEFGIRALAAGWAASRRSSPSPTTISPFTRNCPRSCGASASRRRRAAVWRARADHRRGQ